MKDILFYIWATSGWVCSILWFLNYRSADRRAALWEDHARKCRAMLTEALKK